MHIEVFIHILVYIAYIGVLLVYIAQIGVFTYILVYIAHVAQSVRGKIGLGGKALKSFSPGLVYRARPYYECETRVGSSRGYKYALPCSWTCPYAFTYVTLSLVVRTCVLYYAACYLAQFVYSIATGIPHNIAAASMQATCRNPWECS